MKLADAEFRAELVAKIFTAVQRFAPNQRWNFETVHRIIIENGSVVGTDLIASFCAVIGKHRDLQNHAVETLSASLVEFSDNQVLVQVACWTIGEFATIDNSIYDTLKKIMALPQTTDQTRCYIVMAIAKLAVRFGRKTDAINFFKSLAGSRSLDLQQRAGELIALFDQSDLCSVVLAPIETAGAPAERAVAELVPSAVPIVDDQDDLIAVLTHEPVKNDKAVVKEVLAGAIPTGMLVKPFPGSVEALRTPEYVIYFEIKKNPQNVKQIAVRASVFNLRTQSLTNFSMKFAVPYGWKLQTQPPSSTRLDAIGGPPILQQMLLFGGSDTQLQMKAQISYQYGTQPITEGGVINPIFD
jgi:hypothetical protein